MLTTRPRHNPAASGPARDGSSSGVRSWSDRFAASASKSPVIRDAAEHAGPRHAGRTVVVTAHTMADRVLARSTRPPLQPAQLVPELPVVRAAVLRSSGRAFGLGSGLHAAIVPGSRLVRASPADAQRTRRAGRKRRLTGELRPRTRLRIKWAVKSPWGIGVADALYAFSP
jgi:hypothetical protein